MRIKRNFKWKKIFTILTAEKRLTSRVCKRLLQISKSRQMSRAEKAKDRNQNFTEGLSLVAPWRGVCLPVQERWVCSPVGEEPARRRAAQPVSPKYRVSAPKPREPQLLSPSTLEPSAPRQEKPPPGGALTPQLERRPSSLQLERSLLSKQGPARLK